MTAIATADCPTEHAEAIQLEDKPGIFYCVDCGECFDLNGDIVDPETGEPHQGKAQAPTAMGATSQQSATVVPKSKSKQIGQLPQPPASNQAPKSLPLPKSKPQQPGKRKYQRDTSLMEMVKCSAADCNQLFPMWPQNIKETNYCPNLHRPLQKLAMAAQRQKLFRQNHPRK